MDLVWAFKAGVSPKSMQVHVHGEGSCLCQSLRELGKQISDRSDATLN